MNARYRVFLDSNVPIYLTGQEPAKAQRAREILKNGSLERFISTQVIAEFVTVVRRKGLLEWPYVREFVSLLRDTCHVIPLTYSLQMKALPLAERFRYTFYDSQIIAAALAAEADWLYSEDMQHQQKIEALTIRNPFLDV
ncbi:MAG: PIN domain-containing protein [Aquisalinus sp.]|nr:PIN domain-containing protein [Aquisalinus sp.]